MTRTLTKDKLFNGLGITVNAIMPGPIDTEGLRQDLKDKKVLGVLGRCTLRDDCGRGG